MLEFLFVLVLCVFTLSGYAAWLKVQELQAVIQDQQRRLKILDTCCTLRGKNFYELDQEYERLLMLHQGLGPVQRTWSEDMDKPTTAD